MNPVAKLQCENCHAMIPADSPKCPYCGALNALGSEKQYMEQLSDIKEDVEELQQIPVDAYRKEMNKTGKMILITILVLALIAGIIGGFYWCFNKIIYSTISEADPKQQLMWEKENYPVLDELYAQEDYYGILSFMDEHCDDEGYSIYNWEHYDFIEVYRFYENYMYTASIIESGNFNEDDVKWCIVDALFVLRELNYVTYTEQDEEQIAKYREVVCEFMKKQFGMTQEEIDKLYQDSCVEEEYGVVFDYKKAQENAEKIAKEYMKQN
ncbi:MAG: zinc ribbon domain-containing protein [Lachnospiraceae bacterium]|nr:zinc ribbon domain-containing protein [Lachnospiraceae bacterium]